MTIEKRKREKHCVNGRFKPSCNCVMMKFHTFFPQCSISKNTFFPVLYLSIKSFLFWLFYKLSKQIIECFWILSYTFLVRSIVIWIWRACMRQVISLNQNCKNKVAINLAYCQKVVLKLFRIEHYKVNLNSLASYLLLKTNNN